MSKRTYLLVLLTSIVAFNFVDRLALGLLIQDIKTDLDLTDTELGFLGGFSFAVFYAVLGLPIARWADRGNRVTIITITTALWSAAVALCGMAASFGQLLLIRIGVAVGEAGCQPPALSLISDQFNRVERPRAISRYMLGWPIALLVGNAAAGWLNEWYGWRTTFILMGLPGLLLAVIAGFTLREPRTELPASPIVPRDDPSPQPSLTFVMVTLWHNAAYRHILICCSLVAFFTYGIMQWQPAFFMRSHHLTSGELGTWMAAVYGIGALCGTWLGGEFAARRAAGNERLQLRAVAILLGTSTVLMTSVYLSPHHYWAFAFLACNAVVGAATNGPLLATTQTLVPVHMRATSAAIFLFLCNLIGMGLGPLAAGALSDALRPSWGEESLRYTLVALCPGYLWCAWHAWQAGETACAAAEANSELQARTV